MVRVGLVGYGFMGKMHAACYEATGEAKVVCVADVESDRRADAQDKLGCEGFESLDPMLASADVDVIDICTPTYLHEEQVVTSAKAGKDIFCEKPMALSVDSCDRMIAAVESAGVRLMVGQVVRFWPEYQVIKRIVDSGELGQVLWTSLRRISGPPTWAWQGWLADPAKSGGAILDLHIHDIDYIAWLLGSPKKIQCQGVRGSGGGFDTALTLGSEHENGASSYTEGSLMMAGDYPFSTQVVVACKRGSIRFDNAASPALLVYRDGKQPFAPEVPEVGIGVAEGGGNISSLGGYFNEIKYFVDCISAGVHPEVVTPHTAREAVKTCLAATQSANTGQPITL